MDYIGLHQFFMKSILKPLYCEIQFRDSEEKFKVIIIKTLLSSMGTPSSSTSFIFSLINDETEQEIIKKYDDVVYCTEILDF